MRLKSHTLIYYLFYLNYANRKFYTFVLYYKDTSPFLVLYSRINQLSRLKLKDMPVLGRISSWKSFKWCF